MSKTKEQITNVPEKDRIPELEEQVQYFLNTTPSFERNEIKHERATPPTFENSIQEREWQIREIRRCKYGHNGMSGRMYFWFNYVYIKNITGGKIRPEFRVCDNEWFKTVTEAVESREWGIVCPKRRRGGFSWKNAADATYDALFNKHYVVGMNSKTERDSIELFKKVKFIYSSLPSFLRASTQAGNSDMSMFFARIEKDEKGNKIYKGNQSEIFVVAPTVSAYEGRMLNKWICDEAGKIDKLEQLWNFTEDCLMEETVRAGCPIIFGTSGEVSKSGYGLKEFWYNSEIYKLKRFFFAGWMGILVDEFGNDKKEEAIRWIIYERHRRRNMDPKAYNDFIQKYPLTPEEAFSQASEGGIGDIVKINLQMADLNKNPAKFKIGYFKESSEGEVIFVPDHRGKIKMYQDVDRTLRNGYVAGCDPVDHDLSGEKTKDHSDLALYLIRKPFGKTGRTICLEYVDRPAKASEFYEQAILILRYYNGTKLLIEKNRYRMISFFEENGFKYLLSGSPQSMKRKRTRSINDVGVTMNEDMIVYMKSLIAEDVDNNCEEIPSKELLQEFIDFGSRNTDRAYGYGLALMELKESKTLAKRSEKLDKTKPRFSYKNINGKIVRVSA